jgi:hypothetical protein
MAAVPFIEVESETREKCQEENQGKRGAAKTHHP